MITERDKVLLAKKGISEDKLNTQLACFAKGFPYLRLAAAASTEKGILAPSHEEVDKYLEAWEAYTNDTAHRIVKFVPASGAASRMFKNMFAFVDADYTTPTTDFEKSFFNNIHEAAFYGDLDSACQRIYGKNIDELLSANQYKEVVKAMLDKEGLNYGALPKGLLKFHKYANGSRTPLEEHLVEGALYAREKDGTVNIHFTVSTEHRALFEALVNKVVPAYEKEFGVKYNVSFSEQKPSTDTVAANPDNTPFRTKDGDLLFRPGGHGALIENLNDIDADVVFIRCLPICASSIAANTPWMSCVRCCNLYRRNSLQKIPRRRCSRTPNSPFICAKSSTAPCVCVAWCATWANPAVVRSWPTMPMAPFRCKYLKVRKLT